MNHFNNKSLAYFKLIKEVLRSISSLYSTRFKYFLSTGRFNIVKSILSFWLNLIPITESRTNFYKSFENYEIVFFIDFGSFFIFVVYSLIIFAILFSVKSVYLINQQFFICYLQDILSFNSLTTFLIC